MLQKQTSTIRVSDLMRSLTSYNQEDFMSMCKLLYRFIVIETRLDLVMELARVVPEWIAVKELSGQGKILKFAPHLNAF